ncbi:MAG: hypothetical protein HEEMFOPI_01513 [Holosporales bacterium]
MNNFIKQHSCVLKTIAVVAGVVISAQAFGISVQDLRGPMQDLKNEAFSWMFAVKVAAGVVGAAFSVARQSVTPFGIGAGVVAGIHFFDRYIGDGSSMLLP